MSRRFAAFDFEFQRCNATRTTLEKDKSTLWANEGKSKPKRIQPTKQNIATQDTPLGATREGAGTSN